MRQSLSYVFLLSFAVGPVLAGLTGCGDDEPSADFPRFDAGPPRPGTCDDGVRNQDETHADCGGATCEQRCGAGRGCKSGADCQSASCTCDEDPAICMGDNTGFCLLPTCTDGVRNQAETDVDCGGGCAPCGGGLMCSGDADCASGVCAGGTCLATSCMDGQQNAGETDVDCGGPCPGCAADATCATDDDCASLNCIENVCLAASCQDGVRNQDESDVDCGGTVCEARCEDRAACADATDCVNGVCSFGTCISCEDGFQNGMETDRDCGGPDCRPCPGGFGCREGTDCETNRCEAFVCISCNDFVQNGLETDVDCGGGECAPCLDRRMCMVATDCASDRCESSTCISCGDGVLNGTESDVDCGGDVCGPCADRLGCNAGSDCRSERCIDGVCVSCEDGLGNGDETGTDCGGPTCDPCPGGEGCVDADDCLSLVCELSGVPTPPRVCAAPDCDDGVRNGLETDVDCGGGFCPGCATGDTCSAGRDCASGVCTGGTCQAPTCTDGVRNGSETDVDCGGSVSCPDCSDGKVCNTAADCTSGACTFRLCGTDPCEAVSPAPASDYDACDFVTPATDVVPDVSATGTEATLADNDNVRVALPFEFEFWGNGYNEVYVNANGALSFGSAVLELADRSLTSSNASLPYDAVPSRLILPWWDDLDPSRSPGGVFYETRGTAPNRQFIVQWRVQHHDTAPPLSSTTQIDVRVSLRETSNEIWVFYADTSFGTSTLDEGLSATSGINQWLGRASYEYSFNDDVLVNGLVVRYEPR